MHRWFVAFGLVLFGSISQAQAQAFDTPTLRGSSPFIPAPMPVARWSGFYVGGQIGYAMTNEFNLGGAFGSSDIFSSTNTFTAPLGRVSSWLNPGQTDARASSYGAFVGYNSQWEDAIVGVELNYNHSSLSASASASRCYSATNPNCSAAITLGDGNQYNVDVTATAATKITDYGTLRGRGGWIFGDFMPYAMIGVALARVEFNNSATASGTPVTLGAPFVSTERDVHARYVWGYTLGTGLDYMLAPNFFLRGEYEFIKLNPVDSLRLSISTVRVGGAYKF